MIKVAINGFGRIGRMLTRILLDTPNVEIVGINDIHDPRTMVHLFKYDSVHGKWEGEVSALDQSILFGHIEVPFYSWKQSNEWNWKEVGPDIVVECTGIYKSVTELELHRWSESVKVILSAPPTDDSFDTLVLGVNDEILEKKPCIISNASCTTNNAAPMIQVIKELATIESCYITTVHSYTGDQRLVDAPHKDLRRSRGAVQSIVPTTTGAAKALTRVFPELSSVIGGCGIRVPVPDGSLTDITFVVDKELSIDEVNEKFKIAASSELKGILEYTEDPIVSSDIVGNTHSCIFDAQLTSVIGKMVKIVGWYDNEVGYSSRLKDLILRLS